MKKQFLSQLGALILVVVQNPIIGRAKQSMGNNTFTTYKGLNVLKTKAFQVANPQTDAQRGQRNSLKILVAFYRSLKTILNLGFVQTPNPLSPYNGFIKANLPEAIDKTNVDEPLIVWEDLKISKGTIPTTEITAADADVSDDTCAITWDTSSYQPDQSASDKAKAIVVNETINEVCGFEATGVNRSTAAMPITFFKNPTAGDTVRVYLFFVSPDGKKASDSTSLTTTVVA